MFHWALQRVIEAEVFKRLLGNLRRNGAAVTRNRWGNPLIAVRSPESFCRASAAYEGSTEAYSATILRVDVSGRSMCQA